jgi:hypothetical protein
MELNTHETMKFLTDVERERFVAFQAMFESTGWKLLAQYAQAEAAAALTRGAYAKTWEESKVASGNRDIWLTVANLENQFMSEFELIADERRDQDSQSSDEDFGVIEGEPV